MADFIAVAQLEKLPPGRGTSVKVSDKDVALFNVDGNVCAIDDTCPHAGSSLGMGKLDGQIVTCRSHGMKFNVTNGCFAGTSDVALASYPVQIVDGQIMVSVSSKEQ
jgi:3-phenylpropionate/trans-cinnamate dioxygenase ferredoxin subunit